MKKSTGKIFRCVAFFSLVAVCIFGCNSTKPSAPDSTELSGLGDQRQTSGGEPNYITVQHILIGFSGSVPNKPITRSQSEAEQLAADIFAQAKTEDDFDAQ